MALLVTLLMVALVPACAARPAGGAASARVPTGLWGAERARMHLEDTGARLEYECAQGTIDGPLAPDADGRFLARGTHSLVRPAPRRGDDGPPPARKARYEGRVQGTTLELTVFVEGDEEPWGTFTLIHGEDRPIAHCP